LSSTAESAGHRDEFEAEDETLQPYGLLGKPFRGQGFVGTIDVLFSAGSRGDSPARGS